MAVIIIKLSWGGRQEEEQAVQIGDTIDGETDFSTEERGEFRAESFADIIDEIDRVDSFAAKTISNFVNKSNREQGEHFTD